MGSEAWHGTVNMMVPPPVTAADGESALGAAFRAAGQGTGETHTKNKASDWTASV